MARARPPLPESDDPFVVLGLPPTATERDVRKAQAKLLKIYRPRKALAEFDRLQAATLRALWLVEVRDREQRSGVAGAAGRMLTAGALETATDQPVASAEEREAWMARFAATLARSPDDAMVMVTAPTVLGDAVRDVDWSLAVLRAIGALAWRLPGVGDVRARVRLAPGDAVAELSARVAMDLDAARAFHASHRPVLLPGFFEMIADARVADEAQRRASLALFAEQLRVAPGETLAYFDSIAARCPELVAPLAQRLLEEVPPTRRDLRDVPPDLADALAERLRVVSRRTGVARALVAGAGACAVCGFGAITGGPGAGSGVGALALWGCYSLETKQYEKHVRGEVARVLIELGVTRACVRQWLDGNRRRAIRLARFSYHMRQDGALLLLGMAVAATAELPPATS